jgi:thioredoxin reductase
MEENTLHSSYDVVVVGGGAAGLNGALMLARSLRSVVVIDAGQPRNAPAEGVHGLLGHDGVPPGELLARGRAEVTSYGGQVVGGEVATVVREEGGFRVELADGRSTTCRRLLLTAGVVDRLPDVPGLAERWGRDVVHCPYCHGYEVRGRRIGVLASSAMAGHQALMFGQLSDQVVFLAHTAPPDAETRARLAVRGIPVVEGEVTEVLAEGGALAGARLADGSVVELDAIATQTRVEPRGELLEALQRDLGLTVVEHPSGMAVHVPVGMAGVTDVPGVWAAGNLADPMAQVGSSAAAGAMAGAHINGDLVMEESSPAEALVG